MSGNGLAGRPGPPGGRSHIGTGQAHSVTYSVLLQLDHPKRTFNRGKRGPSSVHYPQHVKPQLLTHGGYLSHGPFACRFRHSQAFIATSTLQRAHTHAFALRFVGFGSSTLL